MIEPRYQDIAPDRIPVVGAPGGVSVKVIAGAFAGTQGPVVPGSTAPLYLDVALPARGIVSRRRLPADHSAFHICL